MLTSRHGLQQGRSRHGVATWRRDVAEMGLSRLDVATSLRGRDMGSVVDSRNGVAT